MPTIGRIIIQSPSAAKAATTINTRLMSVIAEPRIWIPTGVLALQLYFDSVLPPAFTARTPPYRAILSLRGRRFLICFAESGICQEQQHSAHRRRNGQGAEIIRSVLGRHDAYYAYCNSGQCQHGSKPKMSFRFIVSCCQISATQTRLCRSPTGVQLPGMRPAGSPE